MRNEVKLIKNAVVSSNQRIAGRRMQDDIGGRVLWHLWCTPHVGDQDEIFSTSACKFIQSYVSGFARAPCE